MIDNLIKIYYLQKKSIDISVSFVAGLLSSYSYFKLTKTKSPIWVTKENTLHKSSNIIEHLYTEYKESGDSDYELYDECITFSSNYVKINNVLYYRKLISK